MRFVYSVGVSVPEPLSQNRHVVVMGRIEGGELTRWKKLVTPVRVLRQVMLNVRKAYMKAGVVYADLSEYNIIVEPNMKILIIDWPQAVRTDHPNAKELLARDVNCVLKFFARRFGIKAERSGVLDYVTGKTRRFESSA